MGLLEQLWDDTLAGPRPESGLSRLRNKSSSLPVSPRFSQSEEMIMRKGMEGEESIDRPVTKSIMIKKPGNAFQRSLSIDTTCEGSLPSSPSACSTPTSPSPSTPRENIWRTIKAGGGKIDPKKRPKAEPRAPTVYDWVVITALDR